MFVNRKDAGEQLAKKLLSYEGAQDTIVIGLPRGGVVVAYHVAKILDLPLDIIASRKIGMPGSPEAAIGAVTPDGQTVFDWKTISDISINQEYIDSKVEKEKKEAERRTNLYRVGRSVLNLKNKTVILVDDGVATGSTMKVAIKSTKDKKAKKIVVAVPVAPGSFLGEVKSEFRESPVEVICLKTPRFFVAVGAYYKTFNQVEDKEVIRLMKEQKGVLL